MLGIGQKGFSAPADQSRKHEGTPKLNRRANSLWNKVTHKVLHGTIYHTEAKPGSMLFIVVS